MTAPVVRPGQVWADNDPRSAGRTLRVDSIDDHKATCTVLTNPTETQELLDGVRETPAWARPQDRRGKSTRISLARFVPSSTGYRLVQDAPEVTR